MLGNDGTYASKKRKKPVQKIKPRPENTKTNPSKRHRDRLNGELDSLTSLLPFPEDVRSRLDKLSVLRLSVAYIKVKGFFSATMKNNTPALPAGNGFGTNRVDTMDFSETDLLLQALSGIVLVVTSEGYVFYVSPTIQDFLGFHQSDVLHQSVFELIHTEDRAMFRRQLHFALNPQPFSQDQGGEDMQSSSDITRNIMTYDPQDIPPENSSFLERTFVCRMRCLLDNSSGFLALNFQGRLKFLHGQGAALGNGSGPRPQLALFAVARPVQPPSIVEVRSKMLIFQTKHKLDFTPTAIDPRGKVVLGYSELELCMKGSGYQFIHAADMMYCADNHVKMMKTGETGMTIFRLLSKDSSWVWVQANAKLTYKDGRPDFIIARQRVLLNEEGEEHLRQRKLQLPFNFATGEGVLYENNPTLNVAEICDTGKAVKIRKVFEDNELDPDSLLGSFYKQSHTAYMQPDSESQLSMEKVFMESRALMNVPSNSWQHQACDTKDATLVAMLETFEQMAADGDLGSALQVMDMDNSELKDWENALLRLRPESKDGGESSLNDILTDDILSYLEETLVKESPGCKQALPQNCVRKDSDVSKFHMGQRINFGGSCVNGANTLPTDLRPAQQGFAIQDSAIKDAQIALPESDSIPPLQDLKLDEIFPKLQSCNGMQQNGLSISSSWENVPQVGISNGVGLHSSTSVSSFVKPNGCNLSQQNCHSLSSCKMNQISSAQSFPEAQCQPHVGMPISRTAHQSFDQSGHVSLDSKRNVAMDQTNPSVFSSSGTYFSTQQRNHRHAFGPNTHDNGSMPDSVSMPFQNSHCQWPQNVAQHVELNSQNSPTESLLNFVNEKYHSEPTAGVTHGEHSTHSSCMFETSPLPSAPLSQPPPHTAKVVAMSSPWKAVNHSQSPPQASCYFQWSPTKPVVGTASIPQDNACISPPASQLTSGISTSNIILEQFLNCNGQTQIQCHSTEDNESSPIHPHVNGTAYFSETNPTHCYNF